jgi:hypothetical protein
MQTADNKGKPEEKPEKKEEVTLVAPNGAEITEKYKSHDTVSKTLEQAVKEFAKDGHLDAKLSYILVQGETALENSLTLEAAGVVVGSRLKVRSKAIPGDGHASGTL